MRYLIIILLLCSCSCSSTFKVNGVEIKQKVKPVSHSEKPVYIGAFLIGCSLATLFYSP